MTTPGTKFIIVEGKLLLDGEMYTEEGLWKALRWADYDARIFAFDLAEGLRDGATSMRDVTEDMTRLWWSEHGGDPDAWSAIQSGKSAPGLAEKYYPDECAKYSAEVNAEADYAEYRRDQDAA